MIKPPRELVLLGTAERALAEAQTVDEIKAIRDKAEAVRAYAQTARLGLELHNLAAELKLRAERKAGQILARAKLGGGADSRPAPSLSRITAGFFGKETAAETEGGCSV